MLVAGEGRGAGPGLGERAGAADHAAKGERVAAVEDQRAVVDDVAGDAAGRAAIADLQRAGADRRAAGIGIVAGQGRACRRRLLVSAPVPLITPAKVSASLRLNASAPLSTTLPAIAAGGAAIADLQRAGADRRAAGVGVGAGQRRACRSPVLVSVPVPLITPA